MWGSEDGVSEDCSVFTPIFYFISIITRVQVSLWIWKSVISWEKKNPRISHVIIKKNLMLLFRKCPQWARDHPKTGASCAYQILQLAPTKTSTQKLENKSEPCQIVTRAQPFLCPESRAEWETKNHAGICLSYLPQTNHPTTHRLIEAAKLLYRGLFGL